MLLKPRFFLVSLVFSASLAAAELPECPDSPNCVSSMATTEDHQIEPWAMPVASGAVQKALLYYLQNKSRVVVTQQTDTLIRAEFASAIFGWVDDVEIRLDSEGKQLHWRSASRDGYWDFGANRRRIDAIREWLDKHFEQSI